MTAIAGDPQQTIDFYTQVLGLRLVKVTVDVHDPETYRLIFDTGSGEPDTWLTFHCWPGAIRGRPGTGQVQSAGLGVPPGSLEYWHDRLTNENVAVDSPPPRDGCQSLSFRDCDGLLLELVADGAVSGLKGAQKTSGSRLVPGDRAILGLHTVTISAESSTEWERFLTKVLRLDAIAEGAQRQSYAAGVGRTRVRIIVRTMPDVGRGLTTVGYIHHVAFRVPENDLEDWRERVAEYTETLGPADDHVYYRAVHLKGPEGVRLELATDGPGVTIDEAPMDLGTHLVLPPWLESRRSDLERQLPPLRLPGDAR